MDLIFINATNNTITNKNTDDSKTNSSIIILTIIFLLVFLFCLAKINYKKKTLITYVSQTPT